MSWRYCSRATLNAAFLASFVLLSLPLSIPTSVVAQETDARVAAVVATNLSVEFDRADQTYSVGETAKISVAATDSNGAAANAGTLSIVLTNDGRDRIGDEIVVDLAKTNPATFEGKLDKPGFLQISVVAKSTDGKRSATALGGAAFDPAKIEPGLPKPDDFDAFWAAGRAEVRAIPIDVRQTKIDSLSNENRDVYSINFATVDNQRVFGYLAIPKKGSGPFPTLVNVPGAGPGVGSDAWLADQGFVVLNMNVFPYEVPLDAKERQRLYDEYNAEFGLRYCYLNGGDRETYFFRAPYLGIDRAIDWLAEQEYVDASRIGYFGTSQGGASALVLGGLNNRFCAILSSVPALCDHAGGLKGRSPGWPRLVDTLKDDARVLEASRYLDGVNFARRIDVPIDVTVGFIDVTCSPSSVCAAFNVIPSKDKTLFPETKLGHSNGEQYKKAFERLLNRVKTGKTDAE